MNPLASLDLETTGTKVATDRIVQIGIHYVASDRADVDLLINPERPIPPDATECHGITDDMVAGKPTFKDAALALHEALHGCDLLGFNLSNFDVPLLWEEFYRAGIRWSLTGVHVIDAGTLFKKLNPRTLTAAVSRYCRRDHAQAHNALADAAATADVLAGMLEEHVDLRSLSREQLAADSE